MEEEKKVSEEKEVKLPNVNPYKKARGADAEGAAFAEFNPEIHVIPPFKIPTHWMRYKGMDYGYASESACIWATIDPEDDTIIVYRELYQKGLTGEDLAEVLTEMEKDERRSIPYQPCWYR